MTKGCRVTDVASEIVAVVGAIGEVKGLCNDLQVIAFAELEVLRQTHIELDERITAQRIELGDGASLGNAVDAIEAVLRSGVVAGKRKIVCWIVRRDDHGGLCATAGVQGAGGVGQGVGTCRAELQNR